MTTYANGLEGVLLLYFTGREHGLISLLFPLCAQTFYEMPPGYNPNGNGPPQAWQEQPPPGASLNMDVWRDWLGSQQQPGGGGGGLAAAAAAAADS